MSKIDRALAELKKAQRTVEELLATTKRFPEEYPIGTVLAFRKRFNGVGKEYGYVALHAANGKWYTTTSGYDNTVFVWDGLVQFIGDNPCSMAKTWADI